MARWLFALYLGFALCAISLPGCSKDTGPKLDTTRGGGPGFAPGAPNAPVKKKPVGQ
jgi:hypothetical protein